MCRQLDGEFGLIETQEWSRKAVKYKTPRKISAGRVRHLAGWGIYLVALPAEDGNVGRKKPGRKGVLCGQPDWPE